MDLLWVHPLVERGVNMQKTQLLAMILAGGQGSRLKSLTSNLAKPAVPYGGKYRIIDFALSNCANSGIEAVGILTQYKPWVLNSHVGIGIPWDLDRRYGGVEVLPPYTAEDGGQWYLGTAHAITSNIHFIDMYNPKYVLVLSGDHIYKMDYSKMLKEHKNKNADVTIGVIKVPYEEASRFGILNTHDDLSIYEFEEKPTNPKNNLASMGIYLFEWQTLKKYLEEDNLNEQSEHDFGHDIIPKMLGDGLKMFGYLFEGYWKDVGTIYSFWEGNMDLLSENVNFDLYDEDWKIYTANQDLPAHYLSKDSKVENSLVNEGCVIEGEVVHSVLFTNVTIEKKAIVKDCVVFPGVVIKEGAVINKAIVMDNTIIEADAVIGDPNGDIMIYGDPNTSLFLEE